ncbi:MAG: S41 family peptidase [Clostridiaceae bacterium]|nr:S41 family peptidase [Clostridiaceae bacterium]
MNKAKGKKYGKASFPGKILICFILVIFLALSFTANYERVFASENLDTGSSGAESDAGAGNGAGEEGGFNPEYFKSIIELIMDKYAGDVDEKRLIEGALRGMFSTMDAYTSYFDQSQAETFFGDVEGTYEGIGIVIEKSGDYVIISKVFPGSPAEKSGLLQGDRIITVDGTDVSGLTIDETSNLIKGQVGTKVVLGIYRNKDTEIISIEVERMQIRINPVIYEIKDDIGYIKLELFNSNTNEFITNALKEMDMKGIKKIILDLRDNPGGLVDQCVDVARKFVPSGLITKLSFKSETMPDQEYYSFLAELKYDLVILVNGMSSSASEILAGAVQDTGAGILVGSKTYGKAKVQNILPILSPEAYAKYYEQVGSKEVNAYDLITKYGISPLNSEIIGWTKITTGVYLTPKGRMIDGTGIVPDIEVEDPKPVNGIYLNNIQKLTKTWKPDLDDEGTDINNAEKILKVLGYDVDNPDNVLDEKTYQAVWKFRVDKGLYPGGVLDFTTQQALNDELGRIILTHDKQYAKAVEILSES